MSDFELDMPHYLDYLVFRIDMHTIFIDPFIDSLVLCTLNSELRKRIMIYHVSFFNMHKIVCFYVPYQA